MPSKSSTNRRNKVEGSKPCQEFLDTRGFITRYSILSDEEADLSAVFAMGTWTFSPMCQQPATFPFFYITGPYGSGKTVLGQDCMGATCRMWKSATGATGPTLFRMQGREDEETGEIENIAPTLCMDEIDRTFAGAQDHPLTQALNVAYKRGATIPRSQGKTSIDFPVYGPKIMMGMDNGKLPDSVLQRSIRIELEKKSQDEKMAAGVEDFFIFDVEEESAELQQRLSDWAKAHSMVLRDYRPKPPIGLTARQWEIARTFIQLAHEMGPGMEARITHALVTVFNRKRGQVNAKTRLYRAISQLIEKLAAEHGGVDKIPGRMILAHLNEQGISVPGQSLKGLASLLAQDGIQPRYLFINRPEQIGYVEGKTTHRGYQRMDFDQAFVDFLDDDDE